MADKVKVLTVDGLAYYHTKVKKAIEDESKYTNAKPIVEPIGGIEVGETFNEMPITDLITKLLYPYIKPTITTMVATANGGVFEKGTSVNITAMSVIVGKKSSPLSKVEFLNGSTVLDTIADGLPETGVATIKSSKAFTLTADAVLTAKAYDSEEPQGSNTVKGPSYTFVDPYFYGAVASGTELTSDTINGLTKVIETKGDKKSFTFNLTEQRAVVAYPKSYGKLSQIIDPNGFDVTDTFDVKEVTVTVKSGEVAYYVYATDPTIVDNFKFTFVY